MIFLTVGTQFPFDRLVKAVDDVVGQNLLNDEIVAQIGKYTYRPKHFDFVSLLEKDRYDACAKNASSIISHAGMGSIITALEYDKPLLVMPRFRKYGEVVNDHQLAIASRFEQLGLLLVAYEAEEMTQRIKCLKSFKPKKRENQTQAVINRISRFLKELTAM